LQKWSKGKLKEKMNNQVLFEKVSNLKGFRCCNVAAYLKLKSLHGISQGCSR